MEKTIEEILKALSGDSFQQFIREHEHDDTRDLVLRHKTMLGIPSSIVSEQISARRKAREKLPLHYQTQKIIYPAAIHLEQSSSETTARFKMEVIRKFFPGGNSTGADLTGGFGVDTFFLSRVAQDIHYVEPQLNLMEMARHNHRQFGAENISYHSASAEVFLKAAGRRFDFVYIDPSRRNRNSKKVNTLEDSEPDVVSLQNEIFMLTDILLVKASPLLDLQTGISQLNGVRKVFVISVDNECKEVLFLCDKDFTGEAVIEAVNLLQRNQHVFTFSFREERQGEVSYSDPLEYLYEPNASILKAGAFKSVARHFNLKKLAVNTHLYTSIGLVADFPGRIFRLEKIVKPDPLALKPIFPDGKANVTTRNYPLTVRELKKKTRLKDGGEKFLIGFSGQQKKFLVAAYRIDLTTD